MQYFKIPVNNVPLRFIVYWDRSHTDCMWFVGCPAGHISAEAATGCTSAWLCTYQLLYLQPGFVSVVYCTCPKVVKPWWQFADCGFALFSELSVLHVKMCHVVIKLTGLWLFLCCRLLSWNLSGKCDNVHQYVTLQKLFMFASQQLFFFVSILLRESVDSGAGICSQSHVFLLDKGNNCSIDWTCSASIL